jgi:two-component system cell cycle response regulator
VDMRGNIIDCNKMATEFFGTSKRELKNKHLLDLYTSDNFELVTKMVPTADGKGGKVRHQEVIVKKADGSVANVEINSNLLYDKDDKVTGALTIQRDITARKKAEELLRESEDRYRTIFQTAEVALVEIDYSALKSALRKLKDQGVTKWTAYFEKQSDFARSAAEMLKIVDVNEATIKLFEAERKAELLKPAAKTLINLSSKHFSDLLAAIAMGRKNFQTEAVDQTLKGAEIHTLLSLAIPRKNAKFKNLLVSLVNITQRKKTEEEKDMLLEKLHHLNKQLETLAVTDGLTRLYNHRFFMETLNREFSRSRRMSMPLALLMADIDNFKNFNDTYGHQLGDEILINVADVLKNSRRGSDIVARYGGEEFVLLLPDTGLEQAATVAEKLRKCMEESSINSDQGKLNITISLGAAAMEKNSLRKPKDLLILADKALYQAKREGKNRVCKVEEGAALV